MSAVCEKCPWHIFKPKSKTQRFSIYNVKQRIWENAPIWEIWSVWQMFAAQYVCTVYCKYVLYSPSFVMLSLSGWTYKTFLAVQPKTITMELYFLQSWGRNLVFVVCRAPIAVCIKACVHSGWKYAAVLKHEQRLKK